MSAITLYPAIDLLDGRCVRLFQGDYAQASVFDDDPVAVARRWQAAGATWLHVVDLDGARDGVMRHGATLRALAEATGLPIQFGGGLRSEEAVAEAFAAGAERVILGTAALRDPALLARCLDRWGERVAVSVDARAGRAAVAGWLESTTTSAVSAVERMAAMGVRTLIVTSVERDGAMLGADDALMGEMRAAAPNVHLIAAGGVAGLDDIRRMALLGVNGVVLGRALYERAFDLASAQALATALAERDVTC